MRTPLGVLERVRPTERGVDFLPLALVLVCAGLIAVLGSYFIYTPGMYVGLSDRPAAFTNKITTPRTNVGDMGRTATTVTLVSARGTGVFVVAGRVVDREGLRTVLAALAKERPASLAYPVLVKADAALTMQSFVTVCELVRAAGFPGVLIAADER
jgi:biopolymer transport protein ExbD